ncbi:MAG: MarR family transcriptional regulator [Desulfobulbaceae bacterium]|nr:MarR family transcriptional regulator [Desulfobulbaceae bacterium]
MDSYAESPLSRLIYFTAQAMKNFAEKALKPYDLTLEQLLLLKNIAVDTGLTQRQLGDQANKTPANLTRILDRLESKSLVARKHNPKDRRASFVTLTRKGKALTEEVTGILESFATNFLRDITPEEQQVIRTAFAKMSRNLLEMNETLDRQAATRQQQATP